MVSFGDCLIGSCDVLVAGEFLGRRRCWIDFHAEEFAVEVGMTKHGNASSRLSWESFDFHNLVFPSQIGDLLADQLSITFPKFVPSFGGSSVYDTVQGRMLDQVHLAATWRFICNKPIQLCAEVNANEVLLRPGQEIWGSVPLACGGSLIGTKYGVCVQNCPDFGPANLQALSLALGCPLQEFARHCGTNISLILNHWTQTGKPKPLFDGATNGFVDHDKHGAGVAEVYRAVLAFQNDLPDGGASFRMAVAAFAEARSFPVGYTLRMLASMHLLEWLDDRKTMEAGQFARKLGIPLPVAKAVTTLRNEFSHNRNDLANVADKIWNELATAGIDLKGIGSDDRHVELLNFILSLTGKLLLDRVGADVVPVLYLPGHGPFELRGGA